MSDAPLGRTRSLLPVSSAEAPPADRWRIRDARAEEGTALTALCFRSKRAWGYPPAFMELCRDALTVTSERIRAHSVRVAETPNGIPIGVSGYSSSKHGDAELELLFVEPSSMGRGVGRALLSDVRTALESRSIDSLWILADPGAVPFYLARGAVHAGMRPSDTVPGRRLPWLRLSIGTEPVELATSRLRLRAWRAEDLAPFAAINADPHVCRHLPTALSREQSDALARRLEQGLALRRLGLWAVERIDLEPQPFIGFIGLTMPSFFAPFTPCVEIGWRLAATHWGLGLATEGASAVIHHAFDALRLDELVSFTVTENAASRRVMEKLGMQRAPAEDFDHPALPPGHTLARHVLYRLRNGRSR